MSVFFTLKDILGMSIFMPDVSKEYKNGALKVLDVAIYHSVIILSHTIHI